jgi:16S rRNA (adenine1518-N6/adenine1519-N6)-dimethyltransferase
MSDRQRLEQHGITPKKSLGQNFLHDPNALEKIVEIADIMPEATVLEIGPGTGNLTHILAREAARVIAVEVDDRLIPLLQSEFAALPHVEVIHGDILKLDLTGRLAGKPYVVVANLPYYITSAILRHLFEKTSPRPQRVVVTVQREVAERLVATPGDMSLLAVSVQFYGHPQIAMHLKPAAFWPRPDVESAVVRIDVYAKPPVDVPGEQAFFRVVRAGFGQKRKQLRNALSAGLRLDKTRADQLLNQSGIDPQRRAETLSLEEWATLTRAVAETHRLESR